ncbi:MAG: sugar phosphate nucleotidyltransferase [Bacteroidia bacterium]
MARVVLPVAGAGLHLRPHTYTHPKPLIPIAGKPLLGHIVDELIQAGLEEFVFVIGYLSDKVQNFLLNAYESHIRMHFVLQEPRLGLAHAIALTQSFFPPTDPTPMLIVLGDTLVRVPWQELLSFPYNCVGIATVEAPSDFGIVELEADRRVVRLTEKPRIPRSNQAIVGLYLIRDTAALFEAISYIFEQKLTLNGEYQLTDALQRMVERGTPIYGFPVDYWLDCEEKDAILEANRILLSQSASPPLREYPHVVIIPPVHIPPSCKLYRAIVGPYVSLGEGVEIENAIVQDSIIGAYSQVRDMLLRRSVVGGDALLVGRESSLSLGDNTVMEL